MNINLKELSYYKNLGRKEGSNNKVILNLPSHYGYGHIAEVAFMAMLGRLQHDIIETGGQKFYIYTSDILDRDGIDVKINDKVLQLKSKYSYNSIFDYYSFIVEYDRPGIYNLTAALNYLNFPIYISNKTINDVNYIWDNYMKYYGII